MALSDLLGVLAGANQPMTPEQQAQQAQYGQSLRAQPVSYTHLTLPTIYSV